MGKSNINLRIVRFEYNIPNVLLGERKPRVECGKVANKKKIPIIAKKTVPASSIVLIERLLSDIYFNENGNYRDKMSDSDRCTSVSPFPEDIHVDRMKQVDLNTFTLEDLNNITLLLKKRAQLLGQLLIKRLFKRESLKRRSKRFCNMITELLKKFDNQQLGEGDMRFSVSPKGGACGWAEWLKAMRLVARLPTGIPPEFRKKLWLTLAEQHLKVKGVDWSRAEKNCFSEWTNPDDTELGVQIVKDLHRTGCSLFCGSEGRENQAVLKRVLLAYARWNKAVGYCQGFNMLAALILEVMDRSESDSLKVMIYLIEAVLPEGYFANNLRGLSVDMAVFRDLLKLRLPRLSAHLEKLQKGAAEGSCYEPPLTNVFTMQWFLTLFCNCLPRNTVLRVWDLVFLEGDEILLTTALAIWDTLQDRILVVESADEFYSVMGELARQTLEAPPATSEALLTRAAQLGPVPELPRLRDKHRYNITPWAHSVQSAAKKGLRLFYSEDEADSSDDGDKLAITTAYGLPAGSRGRSALVAAGVFGHPDRERLALDISALKQQYARLRERQRQAHIILAAACARQPSVGSSSGPISVNHLLLGKSAIVSARGRRLGPPQGAIPPSRAVKASKNTVKSQLSPQAKNETLHWKDEEQKKSQSRRDSIKWKDIKQLSLQSEEVDDELDEDGKVVTETEANEILQTSMRSRRKSESSSYSECSESSTSTSLCDEPNRMSDFDSEPASLSDNYVQSDDAFKDDRVNNDSDAKESEKVDTPDESNIEFGNYVQEFEELLDRTNNIENEDLCVKTSESKESLKSETKEIEPIEDQVNVESAFEEIVNTSSVVEHTFDEFVDSSRGKSLRTYLDEFRKADDATKNGKSWQDGNNVEKNSDTIERESSIQSDTLDDDPELELDVDFKKSQTEQSVWDHTDEVSSKPFVYPDYRSNSCEKSISSSISSISPILRSAVGYAEESPSFLCYKSPIRVEPDMGSEFNEDEKPIVLKIDKYFEHSPEFFGARRSGTYVSSDEEDEAFTNKCKVEKDIKPVEIECHESFSVISKLPETVEISPELLPEDKYLGMRTEALCLSPEDRLFREIKFDCDERSLAELPLTKDVDDSFEKSRGKIKILSPAELKSPQSFDRYSTEKTDDHSRVSVLEKTRSEELPSDQKRSFSILDEEIEAIRSQSGRRNSERALRIIQENSKILHRILVNQVNKTGFKDYFQEESSETQVDESSQRERRELRLFDYKSKSSGRPLPSPRSASLDESLQRKKKDFSFTTSVLPSQLEVKTPTKSSEVTPVKTEKNFLETLETKQSQVSPTSSDTVVSQFYEKKIIEPLVTSENKTDMFGWENKGFEQYYKHDYIPPKPTYTHDVITSYIDQGKQHTYNDYKPEILNSNYTYKTSPKDEVHLQLNPYSKSRTPEKEKSFGFEYNDSEWKNENNNSLNDSYNTYTKYSSKFTDNSDIIDVSSKPFQKFNDSALSRVTDSFSWMADVSTGCDNSKPDGSNKYETSQSSDLCLVSSSMSFSFDPSIDDHPSSKPPTFNSSDTLCQLTSLDQVSTPISPKITTYPLAKDSSGVSQKELSMELDKFRLTSEESSIIQGSFTDTDTGGGISSLKTPTSPMSISFDKGHPTSTPDKTFNPFPVKSYRQPKEIGLRLGLYKDPTKSPSK